MVVEVEDLECFDCILWLRTGENAAKRLNRTQATVCRTTKRVCAAFGIELVKKEGEWSVLGNKFLLNLEREVHQFYRWNRCLPLRIEAQHYSGQKYLDSNCDGLIVGNMDFAEVAAPLKLLKEGVVDVWIGCYPDVPPADDPDLACVHLTRFPVRLAVSRMHPLARLGKRVTLADVRKYPSVAMRDGAFPKIQEALSSIGLWNSQSMNFRYDQHKWEGMAQDQATVCYVSPLNADMFDFPITILPIDLPLVSGDTVIVKRSFAGHPRFKALLRVLQARARELSTKFLDVKLVDMQLAY